MQKSGKKKRDISFRSSLMNCVVTVHTEKERKYAGCLEADENVRYYEAGTELDKDLYRFVDPSGIRKEYFETDWCSDFLVKFKDGTSGIRELEDEGQLIRRSELEKLEFSRRYWKASGITDWKIVVMRKEEK